MNNLLFSRLYDKRAFYEAFEKDLSYAIPDTAEKGLRVLPKASSSLAHA